MTRRLTILGAVVLIVSLAACGVFGPQVEERGLQPGQYGSIQIPHGYLQVSDTKGDDTLGQGDAYFGDGVEIDGAVNADSTANIEGAVTLQSTLDVASTVNYGSNDLYPLGYASSGQQAVYGTDDITGTLQVSHGLSTVTFCLATLGEDPATGGGDAAFVTTAVATNNCTVKAWQDDWTSAATETDVTVHWLVIGAP